MPLPKTPSRVTPATAAAATAIVMLIAGCAAGPAMPGFSPSSLPEPVRVPGGHAVALELVGTGEITYECRQKAATATMAGDFEWTFVGPRATLSDRRGQAAGTYFGPPATWVSSDGSRLTGTQVAVAPAGNGNLPLQLVKASPASVEGVMAGVTYVQRVATLGGTAPSTPCDAAARGRQEIVRYQADYIFWKAAS